MHDDEPVFAVAGTGNEKNPNPQCMTTNLSSPSPARARKRRKLLEGVKVEVRFSEEGLNGSWHAGLVIGCEDRLRHVEYNELLADDNTSKLVEAIPVSKAVEGLTTRSLKDHRISIRPEPPHRSVDQSSISYGVCVDALVHDAWWEGVIFDRENGRPERWVLFPDQGDRHLVPVERMRLTLDWNEVSGGWKPRGDWTMLRVLDKLEKEEPFPVSIREIWYDVSCSDAYREKVGEWVFGSWSTWRALATSAIKDALDVAQGGIGAEIVPWTHSPSIDPLASEGVGVSVHGIPSLGVTQISKDDPQFLLGSESEVAEPREQNHSLSGLVGSPYCREDIMICKTAGKDISSKTSQVIMYAPPEQCEDDSIVRERSNSSILAFLMERHNPSGPRTKGLREAAKTELFSAGWVEKEWECGLKYYVSSEGHRCKSLIKACEMWAEATKKVSDGINSLETVVGQQSFPGNETNNGDIDALGSGEEMRNWELADIKGDYSTFAIVNYAKYLKEGNSLSEKSGQNGFYDGAAKKTVKKHLVALGWSIYQKKTQLAGPTATRHLYFAPDGTKFRTLDKAVMHLISTRQYAIDGGGDFGESILESAGRSCQKLDPTETGVCRSVGLVPENCPGAIEDYVECMELNKNGMGCELDLKQKRSSVKKHLLHSGWKAWFLNKYGKVEIRYTSPKQKVFASLLKACKHFLKEQKNAKGTPSSDKSEKYVCLQNDDNLKLQIRLPRSVPSINTVKAKNSSAVEPGKCSTPSPAIVHFKEVDVIKSPRQKKNLSSRTDKSVSPDCHDVTAGLSSSCRGSYKKNRKRKMSSARVSPRSGSTMDIPKRTLRSRKGDQVLETHQHSPKTILSWLIDNNAVSPRQKVQYLHKRDGHALKEGQITRVGIRCKCCKQVLTLSQFEFHAGSMDHQPSANIFLLDGRSILDCQRQVLNSNTSAKSTDDHIKSDNPLHPCNGDSFPHKRIKTLSRSKNDCICSICQDGGTLILCDYCPSAYHVGCLGLEDVPEGDWFCPPCHCGICGVGDFNFDSTRFTNETKLFCDQCEREYHVGCLEKHGSDPITSCPEGYWFCSDTCSKISSHLRQFLGKSNPTAVEGYSWTILKFNNNDFDNEPLSKETKTEHHSKLCLAQDVLHECFVTVIEPWTNSDLVVDLVFNRGSELNRLNFWGFYTLLLEKDEELISVATIRILGNKVAELPLIGTRIKYRQKGMCRLLINELEKLLCSLGIKRLLLPAIPELLETWTTKFGFSEMAGSDKLLFAEHTFLNFKGTTMCQKFINLSTTNSGDVQVTENIKCGGGGDSGGIVGDSGSNNNVVTGEVEMVPTFSTSPPNTSQLSHNVVSVRVGETLLNEVHDSSMDILEGAKLLQGEEQWNLENQVAEEMAVSSSQCGSRQVRRQLYYYGNRNHVESNHCFEMPAPTAGAL